MYKGFVPTSTLLIICEVSQVYNTLTFSSVFLTVLCVVCTEFNRPCEPMFRIFKKGEKNPKEHYQQPASSTSTHGNLKCYVRWFSQVIHLVLSPPEDNDNKLRIFLIINMSFLHIEHPERSLVESTKILIRGESN